jgi:hypothetical protein
LDFFDEDTAIMIKPKMTYYVDNSRDMVCGEAELCDYREFAEAVIKYYNNRDLMEKHGSNSRTKILAEYPWSKMGDKLYGIIKDVASSIPEVEDEEEIDINDIAEMVETIDQNEKPPVATVKPTISEAVPEPDPESKTTQKTHKSNGKVPLSAKEKLREKLKAKTASKHKDKDMETIQELKAKLDKLLAKTSAS